MTAKEVKAYLKQYIIASNRLELRVEERLRLKARAEKRTQLIMPDASKATPDEKMAKIMDIVVDMELDIKAEWEELHYDRQNVVNAIKMVPDADSRNVLEHVYLNGLTLEETADKINYSQRWVGGKHAKAIRILKECMFLPV